MKKTRNPIPFWIWYLFLIIPFWAGGFHTYTAAVTAAVLLAGLGKILHREGSLRIVLNPASGMCFLVVLCYCLTPLWAADRGIAVLGILRYLPLLLLALLLMQHSAEEKLQFFRLIPVCGAVMTAVGCLLWTVPAAKELVTVNGRLSGFLQYPNTFAAFLLAGLAVQGTKEGHGRISWILTILLTAGIFLSGSRTGVLLLAVLLMVILAARKKIPVAGWLAVAAAIVILAFALIDRDERITFLGRDIGSLFIRILYYKDALPVIAKHPFGLGYMGYRALETTFQTSRYTVSFVHSGLLQMLLDIGWIPALLFEAVIGRTLCSKNISRTAKTVLLVLSAHALVDFDLQFFLFWSILLLCLDFETGKTFRLKMDVPVRIAAAAALLAVSIWLGLGDWCYRTGKHDMTLKLMPFHTDALAEKMKLASDPEEMDRLADRILERNPTHALAYSAKANAAYARGQIPEMIRHKEKAIQLTPYTTEEYCDYIQKLYTVLELYVRSGDSESAGYCLKKLLAVPKMMESTASKTDPLAYQTGNDSDLVLPEAYQALLDSLKAANPGH